MSEGSNDLFPTFGRSADACGRFLRSRGLRIALLCAVGGFLLFAGLDGAVTEYGKAQVDAKLAALRKEGVALKAEDLAPKPVPEAENAAPVYLKAAELLEARVKSRRGDQSTPNYYLPRDLDDPTKAALVAAYVRQEADLLAMVRKAVDMPHCVFAVDYSNPLTVVTPYLGKMRELARLVALRACVASRTGNQGDAIDLLRVGFVMARQMSGHPQLLDQMVAWAVDRYVIVAAARIAGQGAFTEAGARQLMEELGRVDYMDGLNRAVQFDRIEGLSLFDLLAKNPERFIKECVSESDDRAGLQKAVWRAYATVLRPAMYAEEMMFLERMDKVSAAAKLPARESPERWKEILADERELPPLASMADSVTRLPEQTVVRRDEAIARRALVGAALGVELYKQKMGRYPATLEDVGKAMAWKIEGDPFSGKALVYKVEGTTYLLYSIGPDMKDDGGKPTWDDLPAAGKGKGKRPQATEALRGDIVWMGTWKAESGKR